MVCPATQYATWSRGSNFGDPAPKVRCTCTQKDHQFGFFQAKITILGVLNPYGMGNIIVVVDVVAVVVVVVVVFVEVDFLGTF